MSGYFAYTRSGRPTGQEIARLLGLDFGVRAPRSHLDTLIRWGSRKPMPRATNILNTARAIQNASDKVVALELMERAGVPCIPWYPSWREAVADSRGAIILGRSRWGMQGRDIKVYDPSLVHEGRYPSQPRSEHEWYSIYQEPAREVRLHVVDGKVVRVQGKYLDFPDLAIENPFVRNHAAGYRFRTPRKNLHSHRLEVAIEAVRALKLHFGAVDMLLFRDRKHPMVLEINSAPACSPMTAERYAEAMSRWLEKGRR